jgi:uncharacterized protein (DUF305 family)
MIAHRRGALALAENEQNLGRNPAVKALAKATQTTHGELTVMQKTLSQLNQS